MATFPKLHCATGSLTLDQANAAATSGSGVIVPPAADRSLTVVDCWMRATGGAAAGATAIVLEETDGGDVVSNAVAGLTENAVLRVGQANSTASAIGTTLTKGSGLRIIHTGSALTTATSIQYCVLYTVTAG